MKTNLPRIVSVAIQFAIFSFLLQLGVISFDLFAQPYQLAKNIGGTNPLIQQVNLDSGLIALYPFNGNANDESGNNYHGTVNGAVLSSDKAGNPNSAYSFDGSNDYILVNPISPVNFGTGNFTLSTWIKAGLSQLTYPQILSTRSGASDGFINGLFSDGSFFFQTGSSATVMSTSGDIRDNQWHHLLTVRNSGIVTLFLDGAQAGSGSVSTNISSPNSLYIGWDLGNPSLTYFNGAIDDIRIYNRALDSAEIQALFNDTSTSSCPNLALNKPSAASSIYSTYTPDKAFDGDTTTWWWSSSSPPQWIHTNLQTQTSISLMKFIWREIAGTFTHVLFTSSDSVSWTAVDTFTTNSSVSNQLIYVSRAFNPSLNNVKYVKIQTISGPGWCSWVEIEVYPCDSTQPPPASPLAGFNANDSTVTIGETVQFTDLSTNNPTTWNWSFPGGTPSVSTLQNPAVTYNTIGDFAVTLIVANGNGSDTLTKGQYISVSDSLTLPQTYLISQGGTITTCSGNFYDPGGQSGNCGANLSDSITFCSGNSDQLTVNFSSISLGSEVCNAIWNDELRVYDGSSTNDTLIGSFMADGGFSGGDGMVYTTGWSSPCGFNSGDGTVVTSTNGCLTFALNTTNHWLMDSWSGICGVWDPPGWAATISCTPATIVDFTYSTPPCGGGNVTFTDLSINAFAWRWNIGGSLNFTQNPSVTLTPGTYDVILEVNHSVCLTKQIVVPPSGAPVANYTVSGPTTFCQGQSVQFTATTAGSYLWSNGDTAQAITVTASGNIFLIVSNACGSDTSSTTSVVVTPGPGNAVSISGDTLLCPGDSVTLIASQGDSYIWSTSATTQSIVVVSAGNYTVTVTGSCGNTVSEPVNVYAFPNPATPLISASGPTTFCMGDSVTLTSSAAISYQWSNSTNTQSITVSTGGNFAVTVTDSNGCEATAISVAVTVNPTYNLSAAAAICGGDSILLEGNYQTNAGMYYDTLTSLNGCDSVIATTLSVNQPTFSSVQAAICSGDSILLEGNYQTAAGTYYDTLTSANGCDSVITTTLTVNLTPAAPLISVNGSANLCQGDSVILTSTTANGYSWSTSEISQSIVVTAAGDYSVTITDINWCSASSAATTVTVTNPLIGFSSDYTVFYLPNATVNFTAITVGTITSYLWDFGDGNTSSQANPSYSYTAPGNYSVSLTVTDNTGCTETLTMSGYVWVEQVFNASALTTGTIENLTGTSFADPLNGCASMGDGNVLFTSDGGLSWTISNTGFSGILNSIYLIGNSAYIAGTNGYVAVSINGGSNWSTFNLGTNVTFYDVFFVNGILGYLAGANGTIYMYNGTSWVMQNTGTTVDFYSVFGIGNVAYAAGADGIIYFYNGSAWTPLSSGVNSVLNGIYFVNANLGYAVGASGTILLTSDGGTSWQNIFSGLSDNFNSIIAGGTDTLWAVGTGGIVYQSVNAGLNWTRFSIGTQTDLSAIRYVGQTGYIVGKSGQAFQFGVIPEVGINENPILENNIKIYPNPASFSVTVEVRHVDNSDFVIYDMLGQTIMKVNVNSTKINIDMEEMKNGLYFYQLKNNGSVTYTGKLIIE